MFIYVATREPSVDASKTLLIDNDITVFNAAVVSNELAIYTFDDNDGHPHTAGFLRTPLIVVLKPKRNETPYWRTSFLVHRFNYIII